jgi:hypothetical protein
MMRNTLLIATFGITLLVVLWSISWIRIYFRTGMKSSLLTGGGGIIGGVGFCGTVYRFIRYEFMPWENQFSLFLFLLMLVGVIMLILSDSIYYTKDSGIWKEICDRTPLLERVFGHVPIMKYGKAPSPFFRRRAILIIGTSMMTIGILTMMIVLQLNISYPKGFLITSSLSAVIGGLFLVIFAISSLKKKD